MFATLQSSVANIMTLLDREMAANNLPIAQALAQPVPPPTQREATVKDVQLYDFLKLKPPVFTGETETVGEDPLWFLEGMKKSCKAQGYSSV